MHSLVVGTAGHIDHGKSALVKALTGTDPDRLKEEQARGITIDLGFASTAIGDVNLAFVDVPGHERFVKNMLAGAGGIDAVALVIAADESVMPQTREHFAICRLLGLDRGVIVLSKADKVDHEALELATLEARELVAGSFLERAPIVPVSVRTGVGLDQLRQTLVAAAGGHPRLERTGVVRLPVDRAFTVKGFGTVVTGTLVSGSLGVGHELVVLPEGRPARVRGLQVHGHEVATAQAPARVAVNLTGPDVSDVARGVTLASAGSLTVTRRCDVRIELISGARPLRHGARVRVHQGTAERLARVAICAVRTDIASAWRLARVGESSVEITSQAEAYVRLRLEQPMAVTRGDRLILRAYSPPTTVGGGVILDPAPTGAGLRRPATLERFRALDASGDREAFARVWLLEASERGLSTSDLVGRGGLDPETARDVVATLEAKGFAVAIEGRVFAAEAWRTLEARVVDILGAYHRAEPNETGLPKQNLKDRVAKRSHGPQRAGQLVDAVLARLATSGVITGSDRVALRSHRVTASPGEADETARVEQALRAAGLMPPDLAGLMATTGLAAPAVERALRTLGRAQAVVRLGTLVYHRDALAGLKREVEQLGATRRTPTAPARIDVGTFKERFGLSRKFAIPLLEWLDRERITRRVGDARVIL